MSFAYIWEYRVLDDQIETFRRAYGPDGDWVQLFRRAGEYVRTELYQNVDAPLGQCDRLISTIDSLCKVGDGYTYTVLRRV